MTASQDLRSAKVRWVRPDEHEVVKFFPTDPPRRGEHVLVDGIRHRVLRVKVRWQGRRWTIYGKGIKVAPEVQTEA